MRQVRYPARPELCGASSQMPLRDQHPMPAGMNVPSYHPKLAAVTNLALPPAQALSAWK
jgi:hypothetical protein